MDSRKLLYGYDLDEVEPLADQIFELVAEYQIPTTLAILALCRAITMIGSEADLDIACVAIDQLREASEADEFEDLVMEGEDEDDGEV